MTPGRAGRFSTTLWRIETGTAFNITNIFLLPVKSHSHFKAVYRVVSRSSAWFLMPASPSPQVDQLLLLSLPLKRMGASQISPPKPWGKNCDPFQNKIRSGTWYGFPWRRQPYGFPWRRQPSIQVILSQPCPAIWQSGERHLGGKVFVESVKKLLLFLDWRYKIQNCPPVISSSYVLWFHGWFAQSLYDKIRHLLIAQHIPKACVRIDEQARQLMIYGHRPRLENPNSGLTGCRSQFGPGRLGDKLPLDKCQ